MRGLDARPLAVCPLYLTFRILHDKNNSDWLPICMFSVEDMYHLLSLLYFLRTRDLSASSTLPVVSSFFARTTVIACNGLLHQMFCRLPYAIIGTVEVPLHTIQRALAVDPAVDDSTDNMFCRPSSLFFTCWCALPTVLRTPCIF